MAVDQDTSKQADFAQRVLTTRKRRLARINRKIEEKILALARTLDLERRSKEADMFGTRQLLRARLSAELMEADPELEDLVLKRTRWGSSQTM